MPPVCRRGSAPPSHSLEVPREGLRKVRVQWVGGGGFLGSCVPSWAQCSSSSCPNVQAFGRSLPGRPGQHGALVNVVWLALSSAVPGARVHAAHVGPELGVQDGLAPGLLSVLRGGSSGILGVSLACRARSSRFLGCCSRSLGWSLPQILSFKTH